MFFKTLESNFLNNLGLIQIVRTFWKEL
jgi:hypothetical protein